MDEPEHIARQAERWLSEFADLSRPSRMIDVAIAALGEGCVRRVGSDVLAGSDGALTPSRLILLREGLSSMEERWVLAHELGHLIRGHETCDKEGEREADVAAAAILMPGPALRIAIAILGEDLEELARLFSVKQTCVALRLSEANLWDAVTIVSSSSVYVSAPTWFAMPSEDELRAIAKQGRPGIVRCRLTDDRDRVVMRITADA